MNKTQKTEIAKRLNEIIGTMTEQEVYLARNANLLGLSPTYVARTVEQMSHNSSMLAEIYRELIGVK
jgi:AraC-like DNA-binding protein